MHWAIKVPSLKSFYEAPLDERGREWRRIGAIEKAANVVAAISATGEASAIGSILEVGAGTGAILDILSSRYTDKKLTGLEIGRHEKEEESSTAVAKRYDMLYFDGERLPFGDDAFDFVYASHVLEHVVDERGFLLELRRVSRRWVYVEVPCEITMRTSPSSMQASLNIGHINVFTPQSFALRVETSGLRIKNLEITNVSSSSIAFHKTKIGSFVIHLVRKISFFVNPAIFSRLFVFHAGALCENGEKLDI